MHTGAYTFTSLIQRHVYTGLAQSSHQKACGIVCRILESTQGLPSQLRSLPGSKCILYIVDPHSLHEGPAGHPALSHGTGEKANSRQSLQDFLEGLAEVGTHRVRRCSPIPDAVHAGSVHLSTEAFTVCCSQRVCDNLIIQVRLSPK